MAIERESKKLIICRFRAAPFPIWLLRQFRKKKKFASMIFPPQKFIDLHMSSNNWYQLISFMIFTMMRMIFCALMWEPLKWEKFRLKEELEIEIRVELE